MARQFSQTVRNAQLDAYEATIGASPKLRFYSGAMPANCAAAATGTLLAELTLPADWMSNAAAGVKALLGTWTGTGAAAAAGGTIAGYVRLYDSTGTTCHDQGTTGATVAIATSAVTAANGNVLTFAATTGVTVGETVTGAGVPAGTTVLAVTGTTVLLSATTSAGVGSGVTITFANDFPIDNPSIASGQNLSVNTFSLTAGNA